MDKGWVYIWGLPGKQVKIGYTTRTPDKRLADGRTWLKAFGHEGQFITFDAAFLELETWLHKVFAAQRIEGEWFYWSGELAELLDSYLVGEGIPLLEWAKSNGFSS